jgi:hypothetical protein
MNGNVALLLIRLIGVFTGIEIRHALTTGVARWHGGEATREYSPKRYQRCICWAWVTLALCFVSAIVVSVGRFC